MDKPKVKIEDWELEKIGPGRYRLFGRVYSHPKFKDGETILTSEILSIYPKKESDEAMSPGDVVETRNTLYELGRKSEINSNTKGYSGKH